MEGSEPNNREMSAMLRKLLPKTTPLLFATVFMLVCGLFSTDQSQAATAKEIDVSVGVALERFFAEVKGAKEFAQTAKGLLILPGVVKAGLIVGGEYGEGALQVEGRTVDYYNIIAGSYGLQIGAQEKDIIVAFMTDEALNSFRAGQGWEVGVDGNVALLDVGAGERIDTTTLKDPIVGFVFGVKGLMIDVSLKGSKFTKLDKSK
jgi:lipid-binding SYLF domain-containing protein